MTKNITQAVFTRNPQDAARYALAKLDIADPTSTADRSQSHRLEQDAWVMRGQDKGLNFDLEVEILLARDLTHRAQDLAQHGVDFYAVGNAFLEQGKREGNLAQLEAAVEAYKMALEVYTQEGFPRMGRDPEKSRLRASGTGGA